MNNSFIDSKNNCFPRAAQKKTGCWMEFAVYFPTEPNTDKDTEYDSDSIDAALISLDDALYGLPVFDIGQEIAREIVLKRRLCGIFDDPDFNDFVEVQYSDLVTHSAGFSEAGRGVGD
jgi:hypothetical protein